MKAMERADVDRDRPRLGTSGTTRTTVTTGTDHRWQTMMTPRGANQLLVAGSTRPQVRVNAGMLCDGKANDARHGTRQEDWSTPRWEAEGKVLFRCQQSEREAYSDTDWRGDKATRRSVSAVVIMRGGHCLKVWTKKQQLVALSSAESGLYAAVKTASKGLGIQSDIFALACNTKSIVISALPPIVRDMLISFPLKIIISSFLHFLYPIGILVHFLAVSLKLLTPFFSVVREFAIDSQLRRRLSFHPASLGIMLHFIR